MTEVSLCWDFRSRSRSITQDQMGPEASGESYLLKGHFTVAELC